MFNEFNLINFFNFKNLFLSYNPNFFTIFDLSESSIISWYTTLLVNNNTLYMSNIIDNTYNFGSIYSFYFSFNDNLSLNTVFDNYYLLNKLNNTFFFNILNISFFKNVLFNYNTWTLFFYFILFYFILLVWLYILFSYKFNTVFRGEKSYDNYNTVIIYLVESEKELGSLDDMFIGVAILIVIYGWFFYGVIFFNFFFNSGISYMFLGLPLFLLIVLGMPSNLILNYGIKFPVYLRGSSTTTILFLEFMYDVLASSIMFIRLIVQSIRFVLMFFAFFECYEFFVNNIYIVKNYYFFTDFNSFSSFLYNFLIFFTNFIIFYLYNIGHLMTTILSHFFAYLILVFWFFSFLYTTFFEDKFENYFKLKR